MKVSPEVWTLKIHHFCVITFCCDVTGISKSSTILTLLTFSSLGTRTTNILVSSPSPYNYWGRFPLAMPQTTGEQPPQRQPSRTRRISGLLSATGLLHSNRGVDERERRRSTGSYGLNRPLRPSRRSVIVPPLLSELDVVRFYFYY